MPPNRKGAFDAADSLATLNVSQFVLTSKFQPLTGAVPAAAQEERKEAPAEDSTAPQELHRQDPAKQAIIERVLLEEQLREQFSVDHILQTEQQDAAEEKTDVVHNEVTQSEDYWAMTTPNDISNQEMYPKKKNDPSYWDWPAKTKQQEKDDLIQAILEEERIRQLFSADHMVAKIQEEAAALQKKEALVNPQHDSYWSWDAMIDQDDNDVQPDKEAIIQHILESEKLRQQFSAATLEEKLIREQQAASEEDVSRTIAANDEYWAGF